MRTKRALLFVATCSFALAACGGGSGGPGTSLVAPPPSGGSPMSTQQQQQNSVAATNAAGAPVEDVTGFESSIQNPLVGQSVQRSVAETTTASSPSPGASASPSPAPTPPPNGTCMPNFFGGGPYQGFEYWKPDKAGDANSVEYQFFYDLACTQIAKDRMRVITSVAGTGTLKTLTETVTTSEYDKGNAVAVSVSTETNTITGVFDHESYPTLKDGFSRASIRSESQNGVVVLNRGSEFVAAPTSGSSTTFCGDSAGFNATRLSTTGQIHGWQNLLANGSRTVNSDGSVTWTNSSSGSVFAATPPATFTVNKGTLNTACPISMPAFTLSGGALVSSYGVQAMSVTFKHGTITNLTVTNATLANGFTLNITTNTSVSPTSSNFINGIITNAGVTIATFSVDANGNGTLTHTASGAQYAMIHWHVVTEKPGSPSASPAPTPTHT